MQYMPVTEMRDLENHLNEGVQEARLWVCLPPLNRDSALLPFLMGNVEDALQFLIARRSQLPPVEFRRMLLPLRHLHEALDMIQQLEPEEAVEEYKAPTVRTIHPGRPRVYIDADDLTDMLISNMTYKQIASVFGTSATTIKRRAKDLGLSKRTFYQISKEDLAREVEEAYARGSGMQGYRAIHSALLAKGIKVRRDNVQDACREADVNGVRQRYAQVHVRRKYKVPWINNMWHIDGHHKLGPYGFVIHGAIDGFSRRIMFLGVSDNNRASTVTRLFNAAVEEHGWPSRVRVDRGGENLGVKARMEEVLGEYTQAGESIGFERSSDGRQTMIDAVIVANLQVTTEHPSFKGNRHATNVSNASGSTFSARAPFCMTTCLQSFMKKGFWTPKTHSIATVCTSYSCPS